MATNCVFLSYQHESFEEISRLANELRFRGIIPWVDKLPGGFEAGDPSEQEARRVIEVGSTAFVLYLTDKALCSSFINNIEVPQAQSRRRQDTSFPIVVVSPQYRFSSLKGLTKDHFGLDLTPNHGYAKDHDESIDQFLVRVSRQILSRHVHELPRSSETFALSVNSYERMASAPDEGLYIDATHALEGDVRRTGVWHRLLEGMQDAKRAISERCGRPRLTINGSKHLTAAFLTGRVFNQFPLDIRQKAEYWSTDGPSEELGLLKMDYHPGSYAHRTLIVEIATGFKDIASGVDALIDSGELIAGGRLSIRPNQGQISVTESISRSIARLAYVKIDEAANHKPTTEIHLFAAAPQSFFMTLGTLFQGQPDVHLYEWTDSGYAKSAVVPARVR